MEVELLRCIQGRTCGELGIQVWISFAAKQIGFGCADRSRPDTRQLIALGYRILLRPRVFPKRTQDENRVTGLDGVFLSELRSPFRIPCQRGGELAVF